MGPIKWSKESELLSADALSAAEINWQARAAAAENAEKAELLAMPNAMTNNEHAKELEEMAKDKLANAKWLRKLQKVDPGCRIVADMEAKLGDALRAGAEALRGIGECVRGAEITDARERELEAEVDALKERAVAAEYSLLTFRQHCDDHSDCDDGPDGIANRPNAWMQMLMAIDVNTPNLTAALELVRKAGEADAVEQFLTNRGLDVAESGISKTVEAAFDGATYAFQRSEAFCQDAAKEADELAHLVTELRMAIWAYRQCQRKMLDLWAEGDQDVKRYLWKDLHKCEPTADAALALTLPESAKLAAEMRDKAALEQAMRIFSNNGLSSKAIDRIAAAAGRKWRANDI